ncbi:MAG: hypothetical protein AAGA56_01295, partial [Myxococcota bacterium]
MPYLGPYDSMRHPWLLTLALTSCTRLHQGDSAPPATAPDAKPTALACAEEEEPRICGEALDVDATEVTCVGAGPADLRALRCAPRVTKLTLDDRTFSALDDVEDAALSRLKHLVVKKVKVDHQAVFQTLYQSTPMVQGRILIRLTGLRSLEMEANLDDPSVVSHLRELRHLKVSGTIADASILAPLTHLSDARVSEMDTLLPLGDLRELRTLIGLGTQPGACELLVRNRELRRVHLAGALLSCKALVTRPKLRTLFLSGEGGDLSVLARLASLRELRMSSEGRWTGLEALRQVESLSLWLPPDRARADALVASLSSLVNLRRLELGGARRPSRPWRGYSDCESSWGRWGS